MSLLLSALKKAAEDNAETLNESSSVEVELLDLDVEGSANTEEEPLDLSEELLELDFDEGPELEEITEDVVQAEDVEPAKPEISEVIEDVGEVEVEGVAEPIYGSNVHAQQIFSSNRKARQGYLKWLLILLLLFFLLLTGLWAYDFFVQPQPVARIGSFETIDPPIVKKAVLPVVKESVKKAVEPTGAKVAQKAQPKPAVRKPKKKISIVRNNRSDTLLENLQLGFKEYQQGNYTASIIAYKRAIQQDDKNRDALLGLAANNMRQAQSDNTYLPKAKSVYLQLLDLDPNDAAAQAGLAAADKRFLQASSLAALKEAVHQRPHIAPLHYSLANKYAAQKNWNQAQASYFKAFTLAPDHADYAFNLAVSLDKIGQTKAALKYYQQAISLSSYRPHAIDMPVLKRRMQYLKEAH